ncbi:MAG: hypothetical protein HY755_03585 [Nitrospirae bacterium]|nr:hypothetical protein [Nitrospirota bacterium]
METRKPFLIGIGGSHSGAGKTTVAVALLQHLISQKSLLACNLSPLATRRGEQLATNKGWGAIKYTKTAFYSSITDDPEILRLKDKDTERLLTAGAEEVLWVQTPPEEVREVLPLALDRLSHLGGILIEGNSAIEFLNPDIVIFIVGRDLQSLKNSAMKVIEMADIILFQEEPGIKLPERSKRFKVSIPSLSGFSECITYIDEIMK